MSTPNSPQLQTFRNVQGAAKLAYICEADTAVRIDNSAVGSVLGNFGRVVSYAVPLIPSGSTPCVTGFTAFSGNVACRQAGYDKGRGSPSSTREESGGRAPRIIVGADCSGTGSRAAGLQGSSAGSHTMSITMSEAGGSTRVTVGNLTHHNTFKASSLRCMCLLCGTQSRSLRTVRAARWGEPFRSRRQLATIPTCPWW